MIAFSANAADYQATNSAEFQSFLVEAAASAEDDKITLAPATSFTTINNQPFAYNSIDGGSLTVEAEDGAVLDGGGVTEVLRLS
jgi:hypothetical protein